MAHESKRRQDETRYCENCGISFIWTVEEQRVNIEPAQPVTTSPNDQGEEQGKPQPTITTQLPTVTKIAVTPPSHCPGCRYLLPTAGKERGIVKWYHRRKGYGFITRNGSTDLYVSRSALRRGHLRPGELVEFVISQNQQGLMADNVSIIESTAAIQ